MDYENFMDSYWAGVNSVLRLTKAAVEISASISGTYIPGFAYLDHPLYQKPQQKATYTGVKVSLGSSELRPPAAEKKAAPVAVEA